MIKICEVCGKEFEAKLNTTVKCRHCTQVLANKKREETCLKRYGVKNVMESQKFIDKITDTTMKKYGVKRYAQTEQFKEDFTKQMEEKYGVPYYVMTEEWNNNSHFKTSTNNKIALEIFEKYDIPCMKEYSIEGKLYDIGIPSENLLIEINPTYTHNIIGNHWNKNGIDANYHIEKMLLAEKYGFRCITIWDWDNTEKILEYEAKIISSNTTINISDKCVLDTSVSNDAIKSFYARYDPYNQSIGNFTVCTMYEDKIIGCCSFTKSEDKFMLISFIQNPDIKFNKSYIQNSIEYIIKHFSCDVFTICDLSKQSRQFYNSIGFSQKEMYKPKITWSLDSKTIFNPDNEDKLIKDGWLPVVDCGSILYKFEPDNKNIKLDINYLDDDFEYLKNIKSSIHKSKIKICKFCGKEFIPNSNKQIYCKGPHYRICPVCGKEYLEENVENLKRPPHTCSIECRTKKRTATSIERYGIPAPGNTAEARQKARETYKKHYGKEHPMKAEKPKYKALITLESNYGVTNMSNSKEIVDKRNKTITKNKLYESSSTSSDEECD